MLLCQSCLAQYPGVPAPVRRLSRSPNFNHDAWFHVKSQNPNKGAVLAQQQLASFNHHAWFHIKNSKPKQGSSSS